MPAPWITIFTLAWTSLLFACTAKQAVLPQHAPTIEAIYAEHFGGNLATHLESERKALQERPVKVDVPGGPAHEALDAIEARFTRLANPTLVLYVYPHLAEKERVPVPGYFTAFPLYERTEYARPGEGPLAPPYR